VTETAGVQSGGEATLSLLDGAVLPGGTGRVGLGHLSCATACKRVLVSLLTRRDHHSMRLGSALVTLGAGEDAHVAVRVGPSVRRLLARGQTIRAMVVLRPVAGTAPRVIRVLLKQRLR
jgi:hypothetical protein